MRQIIPVTIGILTLTGCAGPAQHSREVVNQTYVHRYGVEVSPEDWAARGKSGKVVTTRRDGVVLTQHFSKGRLHGVTTYTFPHSELAKRTEEYVEGTLIREINHYTNGFPEEEICYNGPGDKTITLYYDVGTPWVREQIVDGRIVHAEYYNNHHKLEARIDNGFGERVRRDSFGHLLSRDEFESGVMVKRTVYHPNGNPKEVTPYVDGVINGLRRTFLPDGEPNTIEEWASNQQHGMTTLFQNGEKIAEIPYVFGTKEGIERRYSNGSDVVEEITWVSGSKHGPYNTYVGSKMQTDWYHQGKRVNKNTYEFLSRPDRTHS
jgi:antitoxin component YwqK of YwqJK toxin-antitoxin module